MDIIQHNPVVYLYATIFGISLYFWKVIPQVENIADKITFIREKIEENLSSKMEELIKSYYFDFSLSSDITSIRPNKKLKEYIKEQIRIIDRLKKLDEVERKAERYSNGMLCSIVIASLILVFYILLKSVSEIQMSTINWVDISVLGLAVVIVAIQFFLVLRAKKNLKNLHEHERS